LAAGASTTARWARLVSRLVSVRNPTIFSNTVLRLRRPRIASLKAIGPCPIDATSRSRAGTAGNRFYKLRRHSLRERRARSRRRRCVDARSSVELYWRARRSRLRHNLGCAEDGTPQIVLQNQTLSEIIAPSLFADIVSAQPTVRDKMTSYG
jgi:hypothetical protein